MGGGNPVNVIGGRRGNSAGEKASRADSLCGGSGGRSHHRHATKEQSLPMSSAIERKSLDPSEPFLAERTSASAPAASSSPPPVPQSPLGRAGGAVPGVAGTKHRGTPRTGRQRAPGGSGHREAPRTGRQRARGAPGTEYRGKRAQEAAAPSTGEHRAPVSGQPQPPPPPLLRPPGGMLAAGFGEVVGR
ncbi:rhombotin-2 isoform X2 [Heliangelus exortis]|uniref:rhombotin-2 isoform X2 n=1 Tax=Heliangelus exortis TaxID=472823 RepID=UPI003A90588A